MPRKVQKISSGSPRQAPLRARQSDGLARRVEELVKGQFPGEGVFVSPGYGDFLHAVVVSSRFVKCRTEKQKQDLLWKIIDSSNLADAEQTRIILNPYSPEELK